MTNWMTAAGIAFIAGGLATLISLRSVLFGGGKSGGKKSRESAATAQRDQAAERAEDLSETVLLDLPPAGDHQHAQPEQPLGIGPDDEPGEPAPIGQLPLEASEPANGEPPPIEVEPIADHQDANVPYPPRPDSMVDFPAPPDPVAVTGDDEAARPISVRRVDRSDRRYGDRVDGWIRPEYHDDPPPTPSGEYWTPVPMTDLDFGLAPDDPEPSAKGYGWPIQVERLPAVPDYEPATGFDLVPIPAEPTEAVPIWPPDRRVRLPRSWPSRNEKPAGDNRFLENEPGPRRRKNQEEADQRFRPPTGEPERRRPRPRPRPVPDPDNTYVSRHAAEPPR